MLLICLWVRHERACVRNVLVSQFECVCATNVPVGELRVHRCLSSAIVLMCLCHLCLPFCHLCVICVCHFAISVSFVCLPFCHLCVICVSAFCHLCVICVLCDVFCFCSTESRDGFFFETKGFLSMFMRESSKIW